MCRGNFRSSWVAEGGYDFVAEALFGELDVDGFFLEYDDERSGGFEPLRFVPPGKQVVLGLVTTKRGELEDKDDLKRRIDEAVEVRRRSTSSASPPQCGFSSTVEGNALTRRRADRQARADRRDRRGGLGLTRGSGSGGRGRRGPGRRVVLVEARVGEEVLRHPAGRLVRRARTGSGTIRPSAASQNESTACIIRRATRPGKPVCGA